VVVATDAFGVGIDIPDIEQVVIFRSPRTLSSAIQRSGRAARRKSLQGFCYIYIDTSEIDEVQR
ncbi:hypothetical protein BS47DRAFT_1278171, partial [Hydnum rufescens UP504]